MVCTSENPKLIYEDDMKQSPHTGRHGMPLEIALGGGLGFFCNRQETCCIQTSPLCQKTHIYL